MRGWIGVLLLGACGPRVEVSDGGADGSASDVDDSDDADDADDGAGGDEVLDTPMFLAWLDEEHRLHIAVANHAYASCDDHIEFPPSDIDDCEEDPDYWIVDMVLEPPQSIPGRWDVGTFDTSSLTARDAHQGPGCGRNRSSRTRRRPSRHARLARSGSARGHPRAPRAARSRSRGR